MALTATDLAELRSIIGHGEPPTNEQLNSAFVRLGSVSAVALEVQRSRLAQLRSRPAIFAVDGDYSENWTGTIASLERQVAAMELEAEKAAHPTAGQVGVGLFVRSGRSR